MAVRESAATTLPGVEEVKRKLSDLAYDQGAELFHDAMIAGVALIDQLQRDNAALREGLESLEKTTLRVMNSEALIDTIRSEIRALLNPSDTGGE